MHGGTLTGVNEWIGSILFCPPEQILEFKQALPCNDIYAMGMTLYHLLTGEFPYDFPGKNKNLAQFFLGRKARDPISFILGDDRPEPIEKKLPEIDRKVARVINGAIEKDVKKRLASVKEFVRGLGG